MSWFLSKLPASFRYSAADKPKILKSRRILENYLFKLFLENKAQMRL
jgi:hypothetical protein